MLLLAASHQNQAAETVPWLVAGLVAGAIVGALVGSIHITRSGRHWQNREFASKMAAVVAGLFFLGLVVLLLVRGFGGAPSSAVTKTDTNVITKNGQGTSTTTTTTKQTTTPGADTSLIGRAFSSDAAPVIFQVLLVGVVAFAAGALVQRIWLGEYGITIGPVTVPALAPVSEISAASAIDLITESPDFPEPLPAGGRRGQQPHPQFESIENDRLAVLSIRIEVEERLKGLASEVGLDRDIPLAKLPHRLSEAGVFSAQVAEGLDKLIDIGDRVSNGAELDPSAARKLRDSAISVLYGLGELRRIRKEATQP